MSSTMDRSNYGTPLGYSTISSRSGHSLDGTLRGPGSNHTSKMPEKKAAVGSSCFKYNFALVSRIANSFQNSSSFDMICDDPINIDEARDEHEKLVDSLRRIGLDVIELPCDDQHPDGLFVDDIAVIINGTALICNPPPPIKDKPPRQGELAVVRQVLKKELGLKIREVDSEKAYVEGGDVLWTGREIFVGLSERTNEAGAMAVANAFPEYSTMIVKVHKPAVHLKSYITMAGHDVMAVSKTPGAQQTFAEMQRLGGTGYKFISVEEDEAANVLYCNGTLIHLTSNIIPKSFGIFENKIEFPRVAISMKEPLKRSRRLGSCVLLIARNRNPKKIPSTLQ